MLADSPALAPGLYGLAVGGLGGAGARLAPAPPDWPALRIARAAAVGPAPERALGPEHATLPYRGGGWAVLDRRARTVTIRTAAPVADEDLLHPLLAPVAAAFARWDGRDALHGGAVAGPRGALAILGSRGAGKSTVLAALALAGWAVLADDLVVVDGTHALAGPPCVDLRHAAVDLLGVADRIAVVRGGDRGRLRGDGPEAAVTPLIGVAVLAWGERATATPLGPSQRLAAIARCRASGLEEGTAGRALALVDLPAWCVERPRDAAPAVTARTLAGLLG